MNLWEWWHLVGTLILKSGRETHWYWNGVAVLTFCVLSNRSLISLEKHVQWKLVPGAGMWGKYCESGIPCLLIWNLEFPSVPALAPCAVLCQNSSIRLQSSPCANNELSFSATESGQQGSWPRWPTCPWESWVCISATASVLGGCWQLAELRAPAAAKTSGQPRSTWASSMSRTVCQPSKYLLCLPTLPAFEEILTDTDSSGPHFWCPISKFCLNGIAKDNQVWVQKKI